MDAVARTRALLDQQVATDTVLQTLREEGYNAIVSMSALVKAGGLSFDDARTAVIEGPVWADHREKFATNQWIYPPQPLDEETVAQLRVAFAEDHRIVSAWVVGSRFTRANQPPRESTDIALVLDPLLQPHDERHARLTAELTAKLRSAAPGARAVHGWAFVTDDIIAAHDKDCLKIYERADVPN